MGRQVENRGIHGEQFGCAGYSVAPGAIQEDDRTGGFRLEDFKPVPSHSLIKNNFKHPLSRQGGIAQDREDREEKLESIYEKCLMRELELRGIPTVNQIRVPIEYKGYIFKKRHVPLGSQECGWTILL